MRHRILHMALILGLVSAVGPFAIDMYLPALPSIGKSLGAGASAVQMSMTAFFVSIAVCQLFYGPLADIVGRKLPIYAGLGLFALASIGCALAPNINMLIGFRVLQGVGACAGMVIPRAIVRDLYTGSEAARLMSMLMLVFSVSPILAPLTGSVIIALSSWRGVFWAVTAAAMAGILLMATQLRETRPHEDRAESSWSGALSAYRQLLVDRTFMGLTFVGAFGTAAFFVYLSNSSFVLIDHYGLSPTAYSLFFALNAIAFFGAAQLNGRLTERFGLSPVIRVSTWGFALTMVLLAGTMALGVDRLAVMASMLFVGYGFLGMVTPTTAVLSLEEHGAIAGTASALQGALQMLIGAVVMAVAGLFTNGAALPMVLGIAACAVVTLALVQLTLGGPARPDAGAVDPVTMESR